MRKSAVAGTVTAGTSPHELNLDAAQRELDRRAAEGEDVSGLWINPESYAIGPRPEPPPQVWVVRYAPTGLICELSASGICWDVYASKEQAIGEMVATVLDDPAEYVPELLPPGIPYLWRGEVMPSLTPAQHEEMQRLVADVDRDYNKGPKLARRHDAAAQSPEQLRVVLGFEQRELDERDLQLARQFAGATRLEP